MIPLLTPKQVAERLSVSPAKTPRGCVYRRKDGRWSGTFRVLTAGGVKRLDVYDESKRAATIKLEWLIAVYYHESDLWKHHAKTTTKGRIYFVQQMPKGPIKIGYSADMRRRMGAIRVGSPYPIKCLAAVPGGVSVERFIHSVFAKDRMQGEWFRPSKSLLNAIAHFQYLYGKPK